MLCGKLPLEQTNDCGCDVAHHGTGKIATGNVVVFAVLLLVLAFVLLRLVLNDVHNSLTCFLLT